MLQFKKIQNNFFNQVLQKHKKVNFQFQKQQKYYYSYKNNENIEDLEIENDNNIIIQKKDKENIQILENETGDSIIQSSDFIKKKKENIQELKKSDLNLQIPNTNKYFKQRLNHVQKQQEYQQIINKDLYNNQLLKQGENKKIYNIQSSPLPIHGDLHFGHFFNLTTKDIMNRYKLMTNNILQLDYGFQVDSKQLENQAQREQWENVDLGVKNYTNKEVRKMTEELKEKQIQNYKEQLQKWGIMYDFDKAYYTGDQGYIQTVLDSFKQIMDRGLLFQDYKPFLWSVYSQNAVDEEEVDTVFKIKQGIFTTFKVVDFGQNEILRQESLDNKLNSIKMITYVPEPWSLSSVQGLSVNPAENYYIICQVIEEEQTSREFFENPLQENINGTQFYVISQDRFRKHKQFFKERLFKVKYVQTGDQLLGLQVENPLEKEGENQNLISVVQEYGQRTHFGSGINIICPGYYIDDIIYAKTYGLSKQGFINEKGYLQKKDSHWNNKSVVNQQANNYIKEWLKNNEKLLDLEEELELLEFVHKKTQETVLVRSELQLCAKLQDNDKEWYFDQLKQQNVILNGIKSEDQAFETFQNIINDKLDMQISDSNKSGIPVPVFYQDGQLLLKKDIIKHVIKIFEKEGIQAWDNFTVEDLLPVKYQKIAKKLEKGNIKFDSIFVNGCSFIFNLKQNQIQQQKQNLKLLEQQQNQQNQELEIIKEQDKIEQNQKYIHLIEGYDQQDQYFQGISLISILLNERPFFDKLSLHSVITLNKNIHDKTLDIEKISKFQSESLVIQDLLQGNQKMENKVKYSTAIDTLRYWVGTQIQSEPEFEFINVLDRQINDRQQEINMFRKVIWDIIGILSIEPYKQYDFNIENFNNFTNQFMYIQTQIFILNARRLYENGNIQKVIQLTNDFTKTYVLDFFIDQSKNNVIAFYEQEQQKGTLFLYQLILEVLNKVIAPILPYNAQNIYESNKRNSNLTIFEENFPNINSDLIFKIVQNIPLYNLMFDLRTSVQQQIKENNNRRQQNEKDKYQLVFVQETLIDQQIKLIQQQNLEEFMGVQQIIYQEKKENQMRDDSAISSYKFNTKFEGKKIEYHIKLYLINNKQCIRCLKYNVQEDNQICVNCIDYLEEFSQLQINNQQQYKIINDALQKID